MKKLLLIVGSDDGAKYEPLIQSLSDEKTAISTCSYRNLSFYIDGNNTAITLFSTGEDIKEFSKVIVLATSAFHRQNYIFSALACYCRRYGVTMLDDSFSNTDGKLYALWRFWESKIPVAKTVFGPVGFMVQKLDALGLPCILKSVQGTKGRDNYLIHSESELRQIIEQNPDTRFVLQNFIPNEGDWRIVLVNFEPKLAIYRSSHGKDFRNNTSLGGEATLVPLDQVSPQILQLAISAAKSLDIKIAGADILAEKGTGDLTVLEVNRTPQLISGSFIDAKIDVLKKLIQY